MSYNTVFRTLGLLLLYEGVAMLAALGVGLSFERRGAAALALSSLACAAAGIVCLLATSRSQESIGRREGFVIVTLVWLVFPLFGSLPFLISGAIPAFTDAFFETVSGFTTTGSSILVDAESMPKGIMFWRCLTQWLGGMGIIVLSLFILPVFGIGGMQLFMAEVPGPTPGKISPKIHKTARMLWGIYGLLTLAETLLLRSGGLSWFESVCQSFATMATGGFSTRQAGIGHWDSAYVHYVIAVFMMFAGANFSVLFLALKGRMAAVRRDEEIRYYLLFIAFFTAIVWGGLLLTTPMGAEETFRHALFQVVSIMTTTGFATVDYLRWAPVLTIVLYALFFFGGSAGSTAGGIKVMRIVLLLKDSYCELRRLLHPNAVIPVRFNGHSVDAKTMSKVLAFFMLYLIVFGVSSVAFMVVEPDLETAIGAVATCLGNIGPGLGSVGPAATFAHVHPAGKWLLCVLMLLGRLELFTMLVLLLPSFWRE